MTAKTCSWLFLAFGLPGLMIAGFLPGLAGGFPVSVRAQQPDRRPLWEGFYQGIAGVLNTGGGLPNQGGTFFTLEPASLVVDPFSTQADDADASAVAALVDRLTKGRERREDAGVAFSRVYQDILRFARMPARQNEAPTQTQVAALRLLYVDGDPAKGPTPLFARYTDLKQTLDALLKEAEAGSSPTLAARISTARLRLETVGRQHEVEAALSRVRQGEQANALASAVARFKQFAGDGSQPPVRTLPSIAEWDDDGGWTRVSFSLQPEGVPADAAAVPSPLLVSLEIKRVLIDRPWLDGAFLAGPWVWKAETPAAVRDRLPRPPVAGTSSRMCMATQLILARNVTLSGWSRSDARRMHQAVRKSTQFEIGPITLKGSYELPPSASTFAPRLRSKGLFSPELHVLGQVCQVL